MDEQSVKAQKPQVAPGEEYRWDPAYYQYYYSQRPIDPRLPPPLCSWQDVQNYQQLHKAYAEQAAKEERSAAMPTVEEHAPQTNDDEVQQKTLIDRIQEDFPRTPSPMLTEVGIQRPRSAASASPGPEEKRLPPVSEADWHGPPPVPGWPPGLPGNLQGMPYPIPNQFTMPPQNQNGAMGENAAQMSAMQYGQSQAIPNAMPGMGSLPVDPQQAALLQQMANLGLKEQDSAHSSPTLPGMTGPQVPPMGSVPNMQAFMPMMMNPAMAQQYNMMGGGPMMNPFMMMQALQNPQIMQQMMTLMQMMSQEAMKQQMQAQAQAQARSGNSQMPLDQQQLLQAQMLAAMGLPNMPNMGIPSQPPDQHNHPPTNVPPQAPSQLPSYGTLQPVTTSTSPPPADASAATQPGHPPGRHPTTGSLRRGHHRRGSRGSGSMGKEGFAQINGQPAARTADTSPPLAAVQDQRKKVPQKEAPMMETLEATNQKSRRARKKGTGDGQVMTNNSGGRGKRGKQDDDVSRSPQNSVPRSPLLEALRGEGVKTMRLKDIENHLCEFSLDQHGSRFIQQKMETSSEEDRRLVFEELLPDALKLMTDVFGNYVIQKLLEFGSQRQCEAIAECLKSRVVELSQQMYGCRVVQKALEKVQPELQWMLVDELRPEGVVMQCIKDQNGNHVIQKAIEKVDNEVVQFIVETFHSQAFELAMHPYGCRVLQRILEYCKKEQTEPILEEVLPQAIELSENEYGNYVIQHVLERGTDGAKALVLDAMKGHILEMSMHKFASNVVEKVLQHGNATQREDLYEEILHTEEDCEDDAEEARIVKMMKDQYGNYVVQKMLEYSSGVLREKVVNCIKESSGQLKKLTYGKHILVRLEKVTGIQLEE